MAAVAKKGNFCCSRVVSVIKLSNKYHGFGILDKPGNRALSTGWQTLLHLVL
jgi:hypothetical protein